MAVRPAMKLEEASRILERRRNYLRAEIAVEGDQASSYDRAEAGALDEVLSALYDIEAVPRKYGMSSRPREYRYQRKATS